MVSVWYADESDLHANVLDIIASVPSKIALTMSEVCIVRTCSESLCGVHSSEWGDVSLTMTVRDPIPLKGIGLYLG
jgi:hypothetical protein